MPAKISTSPSPVGGLDAYNSLVAMPQENAIAMVNWYPQAYGCIMRRGYQQHVTGLGGSVKSLIPYNSSAGVTKLYAFANAKMFECTTPGAVGAALLTSLVQDIWEGVTFANSAGTHLICFSGSDNGIWIGPSSIQRLVLGDGVTNATWKNVNPATLICPMTHQRRLWAAEKNTTFGWYLPPDQVYGIATKFDFGPLFKKGGTIAGLATWTVDDGSGSDDKLVVISTMGEVAVYSGIDPSSSTTWALDGVYFMGAPVSGHRFWDKVGGDVKFITYQGLISLNAMLVSTKVTAAQSTTEAQMVQQPLSEAASSLGSLFGWQLHFCHPLNMLLVNIPSVTTVGPLQFVENTINSKWAQFRGYKAQCFATFNGLPFFGGADGTVYQAWSGNADNVTFLDSAGTYVTADVQQAYNFLGAPGVNKQVGLYRPTFVTDGSVEYASQITYDYDFTLPQITMASPSIPDAKWDSALWDISKWSGSLRTQNDWVIGEGMGYSTSIAMVARSRSEVLWVSTDFVNTSGGPL